MLLKEGIDDGGDQSEGETFVIEAAGRKCRFCWNARPTSILFEEEDGDSNHCGNQEHHHYCNNDRPSEMVHHPTLKRPRTALERKLWLHILVFIIEILLKDLHALLPLVP